MNKLQQELKVIRVGVMNNVNLTKAEFSALSNYVGKKFINTNIKAVTKITAKNVNAAGLPIVVTINPDVIVKPEHLKKLALINKSLIAFVRLKYVPGMGMSALYNELTTLGYTVVITLMRFKRNSTRDNFVLPSFRSMYERKGNFHQLKREYYPSEFMYICNRSGKGCTSCHLCSKLTYNVVKDCYSLNLKESGKCRYSCPDCFAKLCLDRSPTKAPQYNKLHRNSKQKGEK